MSSPVSSFVQEQNRSQELGCAFGGRGIPRARASTESSTLCFSNQKKTKTNKQKKTGVPVKYLRAKIMNFIPFILMVTNLTLSSSHMDFSLSNDLISFQRNNCWCILFVLISKKTLQAVD